MNNVRFGFDDEETQPFIRTAFTDDDDLILEPSDNWFWSESDAAEARSIDAMP